MKDFKKTYADRFASYIIKRMMNDADKTNDDISKCIGVSAGTLSNKLVRNTFTFDQIITIANLCGYSISFKSAGDAFYVNSCNPDIINIDVVANDHDSYPNNLIKYIFGEDVGIVYEVTKSVYFAVSVDLPIHEKPLVLSIFQDGHTVYDVAKKIGVCPDAVKNGILHAVQVIKEAFAAREAFGLQVSLKTIKALDKEGIKTVNDMSLITKERLEEILGKNDADIVIQAMKVAGYSLKQPLRFPKNLIVDVYADADSRHIQEFNFMAAFNKLSDDEREVLYSIYKDGMPKEYFNEKLLHRLYLLIKNAYDGVQSKYVSTFEELGLSKKTSNALKRSNIKNVDDLLMCDKDRLMHVSYFGKNCMNEVMSALKEHGLSLAG